VRRFAGLTTKIDGDDRLALAAAGRNPPRSVSSRPLRRGPLPHEARHFFARHHRACVIRYLTKHLGREQLAAVLRNPLACATYERRCCMDIDPGEGAPSPSDFKKLCAGGGRSWAVRRSTYG